MNFDIIEPKVRVEPFDDLKKFRPFYSYGQGPENNMEINFDYVLPEVKSSLQTPTQQEFPLERQDKQKKPKNQKYALGHWTGKTCYY